MTFWYMDPGSIACFWRELDSRMIQAAVENAPPDGAQVDRRGDAWRACQRGWYQDLQRRVRWIASELSKCEVPDESLTALQLACAWVVAGAGDPARADAIANSPAPTRPQLFRAWYGGDPTAPDDKYTLRVGFPEYRPLLLDWIARARWAAAWGAEYREAVERAMDLQQRRAKVPTPSVPRIVALTLTAAGQADRVEQDGNEIILSEKEWEFRAPAAALFAVSGALHDGRERRLVAPLVAVLARMVWERWTDGEERFDRVPLPAGRNALVHVIGSEVDEDELDAALEWLRGFKVNGKPLVERWVEERVETAGRHAKSRLVTVGDPLAPYGLERVYLQAGIRLPPELSWYSPVLNPALSPKVGDRRTLARRRDAFALWLPAYLIGRREEYQSEGGIRIDRQEWCRELSEVGIYTRSQASLALDLLDAWCADPAPSLLPARRRPILWETKPGVRRLGPDFEDAHGMIMEAGNVTRKARTRGAWKRKGAKRKRKS